MSQSYIGGFKLSPSSISAPGYLWSPNGLYFLAVQSSDGNIVLYETNQPFSTSGTNTPLWAAGVPASGYGITGWSGGYDLTIQVFICLIAWSQLGLN